MRDPLDVLASLVLEDGRRWGVAAEAWQFADARAFFAGSGPRFGFYTRPRGGSKTSDLAGFVAAWLVAEARPGERAYAAAADRDQAALLVDAVRGFRERSAVLARLDVSAFAVVGPNGARLDAVAADAASAWGLLPSLLIVDELCQWPETPGTLRFWEALTTALGKVPGCRCAVLTTPGDPASAWRRAWEFAEASALWRTSAVEGPLPWVSEAFLAGERSRLTESAYRRLHLGQWAAPEGRLASLDDLRACVVLDGPLEPVDRERYVVAVDVGLVNDATVAVVAHAENVEGTEPLDEDEPGVPVWSDADWQFQRMSNGLLVKSRPVRIVREQPVTVAANVVLDRIARWQGSRDRQVVLADVEAWIAKASADYNRAPLIADPWQFTGSLQRLRARGVRAREYPFTSGSVSRLATTLYRLIRDRRLRLPDDADLLDELSRVQLRETSPGTVRMDHVAGQHDDQAIALALAANDLVSRHLHGRVGRVRSPWR